LNRWAPPPSACPRLDLLPAITPPVTEPPVIAPPRAEPAIKPPPAKPRPSIEGPPKRVRREVAVWKRPLPVGIAAGAVVLALVLTYLLRPGPNQDDLRLLAQAESLLANKKLGRAVDLKPQLENVQGKLAGRAQDVLSGITNLSKQEESKWQIAQEAEKGHDFEEPGAIIRT